MAEGKRARILLVDDDRNLLDGLYRVHRKEFAIVRACGPEAGLKALAEHGPFAVVISDYQMPRMDGSRFLGVVRERAPDAVRLLLTGQADQQTAVDAINRGRVFRFLTKPCPDGDFRAAVHAALEQHRLQGAEKELLEQTLRNSLRTLVDVLAMIHPEAFGRAIRVHGYVRHLARELGLEDPWRFETAALLSQLGSVSVPGEVLARATRGQPLSEGERGMIERHPQVAHDLLCRIPRLEQVAAMVRHQRTPGDAGNDPEVARGAGLLHVAIALDEVLGADRNRSGALAVLRENGDHDPALLDLLGTAPDASAGSTVRPIQVQALREGMILDRDVISTAGHLLVTRGQEISTGIVERLKNHASMGSIEEQVYVRVPEAVAPEIELPGSKC